MATMWAAKCRSVGGVCWWFSLCSCVRRMLCTEWREKSSSRAVKEATIELYSGPKLPRSLMIWSLYLTGSLIATRLSEIVLMRRMYSSVESTPFLAVWNSRRSCIIRALLEAEKILCRAIQASWDVWCPMIWLMMSSVRVEYNQLRTIQSKRIHYTNSVLISPMGNSLDGHGLVPSMNSSKPLAKNSFSIWVFQMM